MMVMIIKQSKDCEQKEGEGTWDFLRKTISKEEGRCHISPVVTIRHSEETKKKSLIPLKREAKILYLYSPLFYPYNDNDDISPSSRPIPELRCWYLDVVVGICCVNPLFNLLGEDGRRKLSGAFAVRRQSQATRATCFSPPLN